LWEKLALKDARMVKIALGGETFMFEEVEKMKGKCCCVDVKVT